jgi:hypothetical protein
MERLHDKELLTEKQFQHLCWKMPRLSPARLPHMLRDLAENITDWTHYMRLVQTLLEDGQYYLAGRLAIPPPSEELKKYRVDWHMAPMNERDMPELYSLCAKLANCFQDMESVYSQTGRAYTSIKNLFKKQPYRDVFTEKIQIPTFKEPGSDLDSEDDDAAFFYQSDGLATPDPRSDCESEYDHFIEGSKLSQKQY